MTDRAILCVFTGESRLAASCLRSRQSWTDRSEHGQCVYVPWVVGGGPGPAGAFTGLLLVLHPDDLGQLDGREIEALSSRFVDGRAPIDLVPLLAPVACWQWLSAAVPGLKPFFHPDDDPRPASPGWWRMRSERWLSAPLREPDPPGTGGTSTLRLSARSLERVA